ncbi:MAG: hypothetical protein ACKOCK_02170 [Chloroflexota bacterium]
MGTNSSRTNLLDMIWPETGLQVAIEMPQRAKDRLDEEDRIEVAMDFVTLSLSPLEFIQMAASFRLAVDGLLDAHPGMQRAVVAAFDIKD